MPAERYRFHCTDGHHAVFDRSGRVVRNSLLVWEHAERVACEVMGRCAGRLDWSEWIVDVHDAKGRRVGTLAFSAIREMRRAA